MLNNQCGACWTDCVAPVDKAAGRACLLWAGDTGEQVNRCPSRYDRSTRRKQAWNEILILVTRTQCFDYLPVSEGKHGCWILQSWQRGMKQTTDRLLVTVRPTTEQQLPTFRRIRFRLPVHDVFRDSGQWIVSSIFSNIVLFNLWSLLKGGTGWHSWSTHCATSLKLPGSIPDVVVESIYWLNPSGPVVDSAFDIMITSLLRVKPTGTKNSPPFHLHMPTV
jgi:hypothetical protein